MKKILIYIEKKLVKPMEKISSQRHLDAIRDSLVAVFPLSLIGSIFYLITVLPFPKSWPIQTFIAAHADTIIIPFQMTVVLITLYMVVGVGANLAKSYRLNQVSGALVSLAAFLMTTVPVKPASMIPKTFLEDATQNGLDTSWFQGLESLGWVMPQTPMSGVAIYVGALSAIIGVEVMRISKKISRKMRKVPLLQAPQIPKSLVQTLDTILPICIVVLGLFVIRDVLGFDFQKSVLYLFDILIRSSSTLSGAMLYVLVLSLFSFFGLIGFGVSGVSNSAAGIAWGSLIVANQAAHAAGTTLPNVAPLPFFHYFVWIGGTGATLSLVILMCFSKSGYLKKLGATSLLPSLANINQPAIYGFPVILNPYMFIPFILGPQIMTLLSYVCMQINLVEIPYTDPYKSFPFFMGAYLSTGDWKAVILSIINFLISLVVYYPFFKMYEKKLIGEGEERAKKHALDEDEELRVTPVD